MRTGGKDTNNLGIGVKVKSDWRFCKDLIKKVPHGCKRGEYIIRPYTRLYTSREDVWCHRNEIIRPTLKEYERLLKKI